MSGSAPFNTAVTSHDHTSTSTADLHATSSAPTTHQGISGASSRTAIPPTNNTSQANDASPVNPSTESAPLNAHHRPSLAEDAPTSDNAQPLPGDTTIRRTTLSQNAPGKAGEIGENAIGALGFGGARVERPKEDQGLGEKIAAFLGT
ncbi:uncharacterized protein AB675_4755 [Cyphellophora attinorum]|uniref:Uncharacterized protein n=1 Tax=Cyphellophora attinorum TaxID=1664694 RepID=A0A0N1NVY7_9EURO|nr:uncharacterized protein AB675_4755 [Phialophora attinorum]KPI35612.1 hypothetical protein AB675_4755 [Phialophora attinorum]